MDPGLYRAAKEGNTNFLQHNKGQLEVQVTPNNNTALHIAALYGNAQSAVEILNMCPSICSRVNSRGETSLQLASREGHADVVRALVEFANALDEELENGVGTSKEMVRKTNQEKDTALHEAVRNHHFVVVQLLIRADPDYLYQANAAKETPLYLAAERGYIGLVSEILKSCSLSADVGPGGRIALHAAVIGNYEGCTEKLLDWNPSSAKKADAYGWTSLHYTAHFGYVSRAKQLLKVDKSIAYLAERDENRTALHIAASQGHIEVLEELISRCPDCWEMVNSRGQNVLHIAVVNNKRRAVRYIMKKISLKSLMNQKDLDGNTPLHLLAAGNWHEPGLIMHPGVDKMAFNNEGLTPLDLVCGEKYAEEMQAFTKRDLIRAGAKQGFRNGTTKDRDERMTRKKKTHVFNGLGHWLESDANCN